MPTPANVPQFPHYSLNVRIPADLIQRLRETAARERNGVSAVARRLLTLGLRAELADQGERPG
jgi:plasmid stability protein